jgi:hypothetical protein
MSMEKANRTAWAMQNDLPEMRLIHKDRSQGQPSL